MTDISEIILWIDQRYLNWEHDTLSIDATIVGRRMFRNFLALSAKTFIPPPSFSDIAYENQYFERQISWQSGKYTWKYYCFINYAISKIVIGMCSIKLISNFLKWNFQDTIWRKVFQVLIFLWIRNAGKRKTGMSRTRTTRTRVKYV